MARYYVSITGLTLKSSRYYPRFLYHAVPSTIQARRADGNVLARIKSVNIRVQHTLTVWEDKSAMQKYMRSGAHCENIILSENIIP
eukprot:scaffold12369_cov97-Cylindrotheca_fusiformis.AAC.1